MVHDHRYQSADTWRRDSDDYDFRRSQPSRYSRDSNRDREYDRNRDRDHERDRGRERDRRWGRDIDRDRSRDRSSGASNNTILSPTGQERDQRPMETATKGAPDAAPQKKPFEGRPVPKGPKAELRHAVQSASSHSEPRTPTSLNDKIPLVTNSHPKPIETKTKDSLAHMLLSILRKARDLGEHEHAKKSLDVLDKRREEQMRALSKNSDFPSLPELHRPKSDAEIRRREVAEQNVAKSTGDLTSAVKNFMPHFFAWKQPVATLEGDVKSLNTRQEVLESKLQGRSLETLEEENTTLRDQVRVLAGLVQSLTTRVDSMSSTIDAASGTSTELVPQVDKLTAESQTHASMIGSIQAIVADHSANITKIDSVVLKPINDFMTMEKPQLMEKLEKQEIALGKLRTEMLAIESGLKTSPPADGQSQGQHDKVHGTGSKTAPVPAPTASNAGTPPTTTPLAFPGDDFTSLRIEISRLNERIGPLEKILETVENIQSRQAKAVALNSIERNKLRDELRKEVRTGWDNLAVTFGDLIDKETKERSMDSERLKELERTLRDLKELPGSTTDNARIASTTANTDVDMAETTLEPFLSPVPEPVSTVGPAEPIEPMEQLTAMPPAVTRVSNTGPATKSSQPGSNPDVRDLEKEMRLLQQRMQYSEDDVRAVRVEFDGQCATLRMMVSTLDSQFNNLTTKDLFHAIIGHLEKMYPNARQLQEDVKRIGLDVNLIKQNNRITDETIQKLEDIIAAPVGQKRLLAGRADNGGHVGESSSMIKRQKTSGTTPNGNASTNSPTNRPVNGAAVASASASS